MLYLGINSAQRRGSLVKRILPILMVGIICAGTAAAQSSASVQSGTSAQSQGSVQTNKSGDRVEARAAQDVKQDGKVVLKKGTRLVGHVTEAQARTKEQTQSQLGIVFDQAVMSNG